MSLLEFNMKKLGVNIVQAKNGQEAVDYVTNNGNSVDLIVIVRM